MGNIHELAGDCFLIKDVLNVEYEKQLVVPFKGERMIFVC